MRWHRSEEVAQARIRISGLVTVAVADMLGFLAAIVGIVVLGGFAAPDIQEVVAANECLVLPALE